MQQWLQLYMLMAPLWTSLRHVQTMLDMHKLLRPLAVDQRVVTIVAVEELVQELVLVLGQVALVVVVQQPVLTAAVEQQHCASTCVHVLQHGEQHALNTQRRLLLRSILLPMPTPAQLQQHHLQQPQSRQQAATRLQQTRLPQPLLQTH